MKLPFFAAAALVLATTASAGTPLENAVEAFQKGEYARVVEIASAAEEPGEDAPRLAYLAGEAQLVLGRELDAERSFQAVLEARPEAVPAMVGLGRALTEQGRDNEAEKLFDKALAAAPKDVGAKAAYAVLLARTDRIDEAKQHLDEATKLEPGNALTARTYFDVLMEAGEAPAAAGVCEAFSKARPKHPMGSFLLAVVMEREGDDAMAIRQYKKAIELDPNFLDAHKNLAILCHTLSNTYQDRERTLLAYAHYEKYFALGGQDEGLERMYESLVQFKDQILGAAAGKDETR